MSLLAKNKQDSLLKFFLGVNGFFSAAVVILIFYFLAKESVVALSHEPSAFFTSKSWYPLEGQFNLMPMLWASFAVTLGAVLLALPLGIFSAIFTVFYSNERVSWVFRRIFELYTGIPSVIFGFWGLMKIVPWINEWHPPGQSLLAGILILALMIFPILSLNLVASFEMATKNVFLTSESLGIRKSVYIWKVLLPNMKPQLSSSTILSLGRAIGETMAVLMVCGNIVQAPDSFFAPIRTLTANIALEMAYAMDNHRSALFFTGFLLFIIISILYMFIDFLNGGTNRKAY